MTPEEKIDALCDSFQQLAGTIRETTGDRQVPPPPSPLRRYGPALGVLGGVVGLLVVLWQAGDYVYHTDLEATAAAAIDKDARVEIETAHTKDIADLLAVVKHNATVDLLQDKDHGHQADSIQRLERRMARQEAGP